jgi:Skp family chaperone for outer membrane proteins
MVPRRAARVLTLAVLLVLGTPPAFAAGDDATAGLVKALQDDNPLVRKRAAIALERLGLQARPAVPALENALKDQDTAVRAAVAEALEHIDAARSADALLGRVRDRKADTKARREACQELVERHGEDPATAKALEEVLTDPAVKAEAARGLEILDGRQRQKPAGAPRRHTRLAILNLKYVVMNYGKWKDFTDRLKSSYQTYEQKAQALNGQMEAMKKQLQAATDQETREKLAQDGKNIERQMQDLSDQAKRTLAKDEQEEMVIVYKEVAAAVASYAEAHDIDLVMQYNDGINDAEMNSANNIGRKMMTGPCTPLYYRERGMDISQDILEILNSRLKGSGAGAASK